jgi:acetyl-CoA/propionyl-CoA carboxylase biotin carboxyl carrier protein
MVGGDVGSNYDPMLAKIIAHGRTRDEAISLLDSALAQTVVLGVGTNIAFLRALLADADVRAGRLDTQLVERMPIEATPVPDEVFAAAALDELLLLQPTGPVVDPWDVPSGWRVDGTAGTAFRLHCGDRQVTVRVTDGKVSVDGADPVPASARRDGDTLVVTYAGRTRKFLRALDSSTLWLAADGHSWAVGEHSILEGESAAVAKGGPIASPMPGTVLMVKASVGDEVSAGTPLLVVEAMKMEHTITAPVDGVLTKLNVQAGQQVALNQPLAVVTPSEEQS